MFECSGVLDALLLESFGVSSRFGPETRGDPGGLRQPFLPESDSDAGRVTGLNGPMMDLTRSKSLLLSYIIHPPHDYHGVTLLRSSLPPIEPPP